MSDDAPTSTNETKSDNVASGEAQEYLTAVFETIRDAVIVVDERQTVSQWNPAATTITGRTRAQVVGKPIDEVLPSHPKVSTVTQGHQGVAESVPYEITTRDHDGEPFQAELTWRPLPQPGGGCVITLRDVTLQRNAEQNLRESEALYESLVETLPMCILRKDLAGRFTFANQALLELADKSPDELVGKTDFDLYDEEIAKKYRRDDERVLATNEVFEDVEIHREEDGVTRYVQVLKSGVRDRAGTAIGVQAVFWDITDKRRAEQALQDSEERFRQLADNVRDVFWVRNAATGSVLYVNPAFEHVWGLSPNLLQQNAMIWLDYVHPSDRAMVQSEYEQLGHGKDIDIEYRILRDGNRIVWIRDRGFAVRRADDKVFRLVGVSEDITDRKEAERAVKEKNRDLETLLYVTSHDLREPLRAIENFSRMVYDRCGDAMDEKSRDFQSRVIRAAERLDQLLADVLVLSRAQRTVEPNDEIPAGELIADALLQLDAKIQHTGAKISVKDPLPTLRVDRRWVTQAFVNLIGNALKFSAPDVPPEVEIDAVTVIRGGLPQVAVVVRDRGPGVSSSHRERIFQLFQRAVGREVEGTGAGLAIVRQIAERHGGSAWVEPRAGGGSQFYITFGTHGSVPAFDEHPAT